MLSTRRTIVGLAALVVAISAFALPALADYDTGTAKTYSQATPPVNQSVGGYNFGRVSTPRVACYPNSSTCYGVWASLAVPGYRVSDPDGVKVTVRAPAAHVTQSCTTCQPSDAYVYTEAGKGPNKIIDAYTGSGITATLFGSLPGAGTCVGGPGGSC